MLKRFVPSREKLTELPVLRWLGPWIRDPRLWYLNRNSVAKGTAFGLFFGLLLPLGQIPGAVLASLAWRGNIWIAVLATGVSNPFTYPAIYFIAYHIGSWLLPAAPALTMPPAWRGHEEWHNWWSEIMNWLGSFGLPLLIGIPVLALLSAVIGYFATLLIWRIRVVIKRRRQRRLRLAQSHPDTPSSNQDA